MFTYLNVSVEKGDHGDGKVASCEELRKKRVIYRFLYEILFHAVVQNHIL